MSATPAPGLVRTRGAEHAHEESTLPTRWPCQSRADAGPRRAPDRPDFSPVGGHRGCPVRRSRLGRGRQRQARTERPATSCCGRQALGAGRNAHSVARPGAPALCSGRIGCRGGAHLDSLATPLEALREPVELAGFGPSFVLGTKVGIASLLLRYAWCGPRDPGPPGAAGEDRYKLFNANTSAPRATSCSRAN